MVVGALATAAVLAALYGPGPRETASLRQSILPTTAAAAGSLRDEAGFEIDEKAARATARHKIAEALTRQAAEAAAAAQLVAAVRPLTHESAPQLVASASAAAPSATTNLGDIDFEKLADKAANAIRTGDIAGARLVLEHAVAAGDKTAVYALAETYDPRVLAQLHVRGMTGDPDKARALYQQAAANGVTQAQEKLTPSAK
jgi:TPR repeat protein